MSRLAIVALVVNVAVAGSIWFVLVGVSSPKAYSVTFGALPKFLLSSVGVLVVVLPLGVIAAIVLDLVAGSRRGVNRVLGVVGGLILLSPAVWFLIVILIGAR
jgi:hypothetical protein